MSDGFGDLTVNVNKYGPLVQVRVKGGVPQCPHGCGPMRDRGNGNWDCPSWGPLWDLIAADLARALDEEYGRG